MQHFKVNMIVTVYRCHRNLRFLYSCASRHEISTCYAQHQIFASLSYHQQAPSFVGVETVMTRNLSHVAAGRNNLQEDLSQYVMASTVPRYIHSKVFQDFKRQCQYFHFCTSSSQRSGYQIHKNIRDCYSLLNIKEGCTMDELKAAYFKLAKLYHPDSQSTTADPKKFDQVKEAYHTIKKKMEEESNFTVYYDEDDDEDDFDFKRLQPQHRQYLNNQGVGVGTQSERQKQYDQYRVSKAAQNVFNYRLKKMSPEGDNALVAKDQKAAKKTKMSNSFDRLVEDMIQESMSRGDFENLSGAGRPLDYSQDNPHTDRVTQRLNKMLMEDGLQPDWIMLQKEIRSDLKSCRERLAAQREMLGSPPYPPDKQRTWDSHVEQFRTNLLDINLKINKFNLIVPILSKQMAHFDFSKVYDRVCQHHKEFLPKDFTPTVDVRHVSTGVYGNTSGQHQWREVWADFKGLFHTSKEKQS